MGLKSEGRFHLMSSILSSLMRMGRANVGNYGCNGGAKRC